MFEIIVALLVNFVSPTYAEGLRSTAPGYLTTETAREHVAAAFVAGAITDTEPSILLAIGHHETRYVFTEITREPPDPITGAPRWSCGVMTPEPMTSLTRCRTATVSIVAGYMAGAAHLRRWLNTRHGSLHAALRGYGGKAAPVFMWRAAWIRRTWAPRIWRSATTDLL